MSIKSDRASKRNWYYRNKEKHRETQRKLEARNRAWFQEYKTKLKCARCSENHPACLDFHHNNGEKSYNISDMIRGFSIARIEKEIEKCEILCKNCHAKEHASFS